MSEETQEENREVREEAPAYLERYQQAREDYLAAELRRLEEAIGHNADRIRDSRNVMEQQFQQVDRRSWELRSHMDQRLDDVERRIDQRYGNPRHPVDSGFQDLKEAIQRRTRRTQVFGTLTVGLEIAILAILVQLLMR